MSALQIVCLFSVHFLLGSAVVTPELEVTITADGSYSVGIKNGGSKEYWFLSGPLMVMNNDKMYSSEDGSLKIDSYNVYNFTRQSYFGYIVEYEWTWSSPDGAVKVDTEIDVFYNDSSYQWPVPVAVFQMSIGSALSNKEGTPMGIQASYPTFKPLVGSEPGERGWMTYSGNSTCSRLCCNSRFRNVPLKSFPRS